MENENRPRPGDNLRKLLQQHEVGRVILPTTRIAADIQSRALMTNYQEWPDRAMRTLYSQILHTFIGVDVSRVVPGDDAIIENIRVLAHILGQLPDKMRADLDQGITEYFEEAADDKPRSLVMEVKSSYLVLKDYLSEQKEQEM